ncbi:putative midasin [Geopyxis carbonaria]|nr:putative midasin [Geopyxis carbonaria]
MDCREFDERFAATVSASPELSAQLPSEARSILSHSNASSNTYLDTLSRLSIHPVFSSHILVCYEPLFPELVARWRNIATPVQMAAAFGRVLPVVPYLAEMAEYFLMPKNGEKGLLSTLNPSDLTEAAHESALLEVLLALHRLLCFKREAFLPLIDAAELYQLLQHPHRPIRYVAIRILCIYLEVADAMQEDMFGKYGVGAQSENVMGVWENQEIDYGFLMISEGRRCKELAGKLAATRVAPSIVMNTMPERIIQSSDFNPLIADLCGVLTPRLGGNNLIYMKNCERPLSADVGSPQNSITIVDTPTTRSNIHSLALALRSPKPVLVTGHAGSGKTTLIHQIADNLNALETMVSVHLGDQTDAKLLIGTYTTSSETPGSFEWRPGVLATAVREGRWVLVEDIDKAPTEVLGVLLPLIERGELLLPSRGEKIKAARGFRLVTTIRTSASKKAGTAATNLVGSRLWERVNVEMPAEQELEMIVNGRFPLLHAISPSVMNVYTTVQKLYQEPSFFAISKTSLGRQISPRDLFKWCTRINTLFVSAGVKTGTEALPDGLFDEVFREAVDCFAGSLHTLEAKKLIVGRIAEELHVPSQRLDLFLYGHQPGFKDSERALVVGRAKLRKKKDTSALKRRNKSFGTQKRPFATTAHALRLMEQVGVAVRLSEPILLVGETGTGKTTIVQHLADLLGFNLTAINLSQQTESGDLLGGFKPVDVKSLAVPLKETFERLFDSTFSAKKNQRFLEVLAKCWNKQQWKSVIKLWGEAVKMADATLAAAPKPVDDTQRKKRKLDGVEKAALQAQWAAFATSVDTLEKQSAQLSKSFAFAFVEGGLVRAARNGDWVLLDEINLASPDTLESIADLLKDGGGGSIILSEKGDVERVRAHPDFRIFACMNPATDVGKRDLPPSLRSRFTELYVANPDSDLENLLAIVKEYIGHLSTSDERVYSDVAQLYLEAKKLADDHRLVDGANTRPHFSMRTLTRTLSYVSEICNVYGLRRSLYEGFCMSFLTLLDRASELVLLPAIDKHILSSQTNVRSWLHQIPRRPTDGENYVQFQHYWMRRGALEPQEQAHYILTPFVQRNMLNLVRATATRKFPVLIQGPTSSGKTSMIEYLAKRTGNVFVRINNHEHTDLQEYMGTYVSDSDGQLTFREGILIEALRKGHWIVLDELNLAPTDVLEALNRLLDDNRELLIPETQEVVRPHPDFLLFATQNPPGLYGGRKNLSRAFRNRFLELHFDDIPEDELGTILRERCQIAPSHGERIVKVYKELSLLRQGSRLFEQKHSFATLRDLFRWANRGALGYQQLAENGFVLLAERVRKPDERDAVKAVLEKVMRVKIDEAALYTAENTPEYALYQAATTAAGAEAEAGVVWTSAMRRLFSLVAQALRNNEPVLLVGETGCGKTTVAQMLATAFGKALVSVNAHQNTETGDIIGAQRPKRNRSTYRAELIADLAAVLGAPVEGAELKPMLAAYRALSADALAAVPEDVKERIEANLTRSKGLFEWADGPLISAMKLGAPFLLDEISLADDSVLERLNSVLEPERRILLAEKGPIESQITASPGFQFLATMNPGGDYGKKELSPALRNRFTEIWVPPMTDAQDVLQIVDAKLAAPARGRGYGSAMVKFTQWFAKTFRGAATGAGGAEAAISIRDILAWIRFVNIYAQKEAAFGLLHGAALVFFDGLGANPSAALSVSGEALGVQKRRCVEKLSELVGEDLSAIYAEAVTTASDEHALRLGAFELPKKKGALADISFNLTAPTTALNAMRVLRAMALNRPILLEGSPGVGKTSLITALAAATGNALTRINLSEQTDLMDLFGADVPVSGGASGEFAWRDAPFLRAMQRGEWVLLDEMNLASQPVLEGLNACLDHRGEAYVAELDRVFKCHPGFVVFAAQNPHSQGGGRKGLPASFVNRFTVVHVEALQAADLRMIAERLYPGVEKGTVEKTIAFVAALDAELARNRGFGAQGGPWEFNLRDTLRWLELLSAASPLPAEKTPAMFVDVIVRQRFRTPADRARVDALFAAVFGHPLETRSYYHHLTPSTLQIGHAALQRHTTRQPADTAGLAVLPHQLPVLETLMTCITHATPVILAGASGSGKSTMVRLLAGLVGAEVETLALNNDVDTTDIVGGFEQVDVARRILALVAEVGETAVKYVSAIISDEGHVVPDAAVSRLLEFCRAPAGGVEGDVETLLHLQSLLHDAAQATTAFNAFAAHLTAPLAAARRPKTARFEWVSGQLVRAVSEGRWLVLDNANLCSPSVLDRLNSLLEVGGALAVNEHCDADGAPELVTPHEGFRLFLVVDPRHGELSRAMRNRCVEVFVESPQEEKDEKELVQLAQYVPTSEADTAMVGRLERVVDADKGEDVAEEVYPHLLRIALEHAAATAVPLLSRWRSRLPADSPASDVVRQFLEFAEHPAVQHALAQLRPTLEGGHATTLIPLRNPYLFPTNKTDATTAVGTFLDLAYQVLSLRATQDRVLSATTTSKLAEMTVLARSAAAKNSKRGKFGGSIGAHLFDFLTALRTILESQLDVAGSGSAEQLQELVHLWRDLVTLSSSPSLDESVFHVYLSLFNAWLATAREADAPYVAAAEKAVDAFKAPLQLTTGLSMERMWRVMRPAVPRDLESWGQYLELLEVMGRFDGVVVDGDLTPLLAPRKALAHAAAALLTDGADVSELLPAMTDAITQLTASTPQQPYSGVFTPVFDLLHKLLFLTHATTHSTHTSTELTDDTLKLLHYAARPTTALLPYLLPHRAHDQVVADFWTYPSDKSLRGPAAVFGGVVAVQMLDIATTTGEAVIGQLRPLADEISEMARQFVAHIPAVTVPPQYGLQRLLVRKLRLLVEIHADTYTPAAWTTITQYFDQLEGNTDVVLIGHSQIEAFRAAIQSSALPHFRAACEPLLADVHDWIYGGYSGDLPAIGRAWNAYAVAALTLYVPNLALDPAQPPAVQRSRYRTRLAELRAEIDAEGLFEARYFSGQQRNARIALLEARLAALGDEPEDSKIARPVESEMSALQGDLVNLLTVVLTADPASRTLPPQERRLLQANLDVVLQRLQSGYAVYKDLLDPIVGFVYALKTGLALEAAPDASTSLLDDALAPFVDPLHAAPLPATAAATDAQLHQMHRVAARVTVEAAELVGEAREGVKTLLRRMYEQWRDATAAGVERAAVKASLYRYRGEGEDYDEREFRVMFPDYEERDDDDDKMEEKEKDDGNKDGTEGIPEHQVLGAAIAECQAAIFAPPTATTTKKGESELDLSLPALTAAGAALWRKTVTDPRATPLSSEKLEQLLPAILTSLHSSAAWIRGARPAKAGHYDFYLHPNLSEAHKLVALISRLSARLTQLRALWPENITLADAATTAHELMSFPTSTPVAKFLSKVEKLHGILHEWQGVASREFSTAEHFDALTQLTIAWRRLELTTWGALFDAEDAKVRVQARGWWFFVYESAVYSPDALAAEGLPVTDHTNLLLTSLVAFLATSSVGQFPHRLALLRSFAATSPLASPIANLVCYYSQYLGGVNEALRAARKSAEKAVAEVVLLASWKDTNIVALRDSAKRSHHKLYKTVRKYRAALDAPVGGLLGSMPAPPTDGTITTTTATTTTTALVFNDTLVRKAYEAAIKPWTSRPARLRDPLATATTMTRIASAPADSIAVGPHLDSFTAGIIETMRDLQAETTDSKEAAKHLKSRKRKALATALRELRGMGVMSNLSRAAMARQGSLEGLLAATPALEDGSENGGVQTYWVRVVEALMKARAATKEHSPDLERNEVARMGGYLEHLMAMLLDQREAMARVGNELKELRSAAERYELLADLEKGGRVYGKMTVVDAAAAMLPTRDRLDWPYHPTLTLPQTAEVRRRMAWLPQLVDAAVELLRVHTGFTGAAMAELETEMGGWRLKAVDLASTLEEQMAVIVHRNLWPQAAKDRIEECVAHMNAIHARLDALMSVRPELRYVFLPLHAWTGKSAVEATRHFPRDGELAARPPPTELDATLENVTASIFVALQHVNTALANAPVDTENQGWLLAHQASSAAALKGLHMRAVAKKLADAIEFAAEVWPRDDGESTAVRAVFAAYAPLVLQYVRICEGHVQRSIGEHRATAKTAYVLCTSAATLFSKGFCQPAEEGQEEEKGGSGVETGTGLGDGEGAEDISKDIKDDEDLSELAQEKNKEEREEEIEDEKDAVDMDQEDMEGEMGDMEQKEDGEEGEDGKDEDEEKEMDEEVGDVDDLDPTAVDEKMWDKPEGEDEEMKEKEGGDSKQQQQGDESEAKREGEAKGEQGDPEDPNEEPEESAGQDQDDKVEQQDAEGMDEHVPEVETLELPDDLNLDGSDEEEKEDGDMNMDDLSDVEDEKMTDEKMQDADEKPDAFPELDAPPPDDTEVKDGEEEGDEAKEEQGDGVVDTDPEDEGDGEDEPQPEDDNLLQTRPEDASKEADETVPSEVHGVEGGPDAQDTADAAASAMQEQGEENQADAEKTGKGQTNDQSADQEQTAGEAEQDASQAQQNAEREQQAAKEQQFQKVGDILEKWHRQRKEIISAQDEEERAPVDDMELDDPEFEHLPNDEAAADAQALGAATEEQASGIDETMAIDSGEKDLTEAMQQDEPADDAADDKQPEIVEHDQDKPTDDADAAGSDRAGAMIGETREADPRNKVTRTDEDDAMDLDGDTANPHDADSDQHSSILPTPLTDLEPTRPLTEARALWQHYESITRPLSAGLTEQLRLILEPTQATKMRGDFRTGKRLNLRRILPYIASDFKKDKIWMRRAKPSKRQYQVVLAVDDSKSMAEPSTAGLALETVALVARALSSLEVGQICVLSFGEQTRVVHAFDAPFTADSGVAAFQRFTFAQARTDVHSLMTTSLSLFSDARNTAAHGTPTDLWQLQIVISDGVCEGHDALRRLVRKAQEARVMVVFVIVDGTREGSVLDLNRVSFVDGEVRTERYLDGFPFAYYLVVRDVRELPGVLSGALRSWFAESVEVA